MAATAAVVVAAAWALWPREDDRTRSGGETPSTVAVSSTAGMAGEALFNQKCAVCHGRHAAGSPQGPPLVHRYYKPGHHSDMSFLLAVRRGVRAHHWRFGNMPPVPGLSDRDVMAIVGYVRALQRAKGIY